MAYAFIAGCNAYHYAQGCDTIAVRCSDTREAMVKTRESYSNSKDVSLGLVSSFKVEGGEALMSIGLACTDGVVSRPTSPAAAV